MKITIFTPTYNRAGTLPRVFHSLMAQTCLDFEWLIVDDGSTDRTEELIAVFQEKARFPIRYYWKENGGKHTAYNKALECANGEWMVCLDSDDMLAEDAVELLCSEMDRHPELNGVVAYKTDLSGRYIGDIIPENVTALRIPELGLRYHCSGEYVFAYEVGIARRFAFPVFEGERFSPEGVMLDMLGQECVVSVLPKVLMLCEYQNDGYTAQVNKLIRENPCAYTQCFMQRIDLSITLKDRIKSAGRYQCYRRFAKEKAPRYNGRHKALTACCIPVGCFFYLYYKLVRGF